MQHQKRAHERRQRDVRMLRAQLLKSHAPARARLEQTRHGKRRSGPQSAESSHEKQLGETRRTVDGEPRFFMLLSLRALRTEKRLQGRPRATDEVSRCTRYAAASSPPPRQPGYVAAASASGSPFAVPPLLGRPSSRLPLSSKNRGTISQRRVGLHSGRAERLSSSLNSVRPLAISTASTGSVSDR